MHHIVTNTFHSVDINIRLVTLVEYLTMQFNGITKLFLKKYCLIQSVAVCRSEVMMLRGIPSVWCGQEGGGEEGLTELHSVSEAK